jgi:hypothetical protein
LLDYSNAHLLADGTIERVAAGADPGPMAIGRALVPTYFSAVEPFEQDLATPIPAVAAVEGARAGWPGWTRRATGTTTWRPR